MDDDKKDEGAVEEGVTDEGATEESTEDVSATEESTTAVSGLPGSEQATGSEQAGEEAPKDEGYQFDDDISSAAPVASSAGGGGGGGGEYADEIFSKTVHAKFRTFYIDLKESKNGKFVKVSEKSRGRKSTIMMDAEDVPAIIEALQEAQKQL